ncbi:MAG TPA: gamma-butyrobetaine hydroxylase-like domain-containing protein [Geminicoccaceae bacterium]|nr:gamma-butyrobetaine hydroxylase-like domain-containing protein [Geminicoccaceae bacterium]
MPAVTGATVVEGGRGLRLAFADGRAARFHALWLRDNALDGEIRDPRNGQRLITVLDIPADTRVASADVSPEGDLRLRFEPGGKETSYPAGFLAERVHDGVEPRPRGWTGPEIERWDSSLRHPCPPRPTAKWCRTGRRSAGGSRRCAASASPC